MLKNLQRNQFLGIMFLSPTEDQMEKLFWELNHIHTRHINCWWEAENSLTFLGGCYFIQQCSNSHKQYWSLGIRQYLIFFGLKVTFAAESESFESVDSLEPHCQAKPSLRGAVIYNKGVATCFRCKLYTKLKYRPLRISIHWILQVKLRITTTPIPECLFWIIFATYESPGADFI